MTRLTATLMHGDRGGDGRYTFEIDAPFETATPEQIMAGFIDGLHRSERVEKVAYEIGVARRSPRAEVVTVIGEMDFGDDNLQPFMCMIAPA